MSTRGNVHMHIAVTGEYANHENGIDNNYCHNYKPKMHTTP